MHGQLNVKITYVNCILSGVIHYLHLSQRNLQDYNESKKNELFTYAFQQFVWTPYKLVNYPDDDDDDRRRNMSAMNNK